MKALFVLFPLALLAACATPRESCIADQTRDLRVIDGLISEDEATLRRGYALDRRVVQRSRVTLCTSYASRSGRISPSLGYCTGSRLDTRLVPEAVDLSEVRQRLAGLREKRAELGTAASRGVAACRAQYPAG